MKKPWKFMVATLIILFAVYLLVKKYSFSITDMSTKIGNRVGGGELGISDYYTLKSYIDLYKKYIEENKYENAYGMLSYSYKSYVPYEEYLKNIKKDNVKDYVLKDIDIITDTTYDAILVTSGDERHYSMIIDTNSKDGILYPDSFLKHKEVNEKVNKKKVEVVLNDYVVNIDKCTLNFKIKNNTSDTVKFSSSNLLTDKQDIVQNEDEIALNAKEEKEITIEYETDYAFPKQIALYRTTDDADKFIEYIIDIK